MTAASQKKAWVVSVDMGYGHQRAAFPLRHLSGNEVVNANKYPGIPKSDQDIWRRSRMFYEFISRFKHVPLIGEQVFSFYDKLQSIPTFYPRRDLSAPTLQVTQIQRLIEKSGWGKHLIEKLAKNPIPIITTFFVPAFMAEHFQYPGEIYCIVTDTDMSRAWVPRHPERSRIKYLAPTYRVADRLKLYGIKEENIFLTGFPLPGDNLGGRRLANLKVDMRNRLSNLDPTRRYCKLHQTMIERYLDVSVIPKKSTHPLTIMFAVGGAGAQREIGVTAMTSLRKRIQDHQIRFILVAGINKEVADYFSNSAREIGLGNELGKHVSVIFSDTKDEYFSSFNKELRTTDVLWSKPSELSFYTALGIPLIMAPPIGSQEFFNQHWIEVLGSGSDQEDPRYTDEWLFDWLRSGWLAEASMEGFVEAPKYGTYNVETIIDHGDRTKAEISSVLQY